MCERNIYQLALARPKVGIWPATPACALTGNQTSDLSVCRPALNTLSHTTRATQVYITSIRKHLILATF